MRNDNERARGLLLAQPLTEPGGEGVILFAIRRAKTPVVASPAIEHAGTARGDLAVGQSVPGAERKLAEPIVKLQLRGSCEMLANDFGGSLRAPQRARDDPGGFGLRQCVEEPPGGMSLGDACCGQRRVGSALISP